MGTVMLRSLINTWTNFLASKTVLLCIRDLTEKYKPVCMHILFLYVMLDFHKVGFINWIY